MERHEGNSVVRVLARPMFDGNEAAVVEYGGREHWSAQQLAVALGADADSIRRSVSRSSAYREGKDYRVVAGHDLDALKAAGLAEPNAPSLMLLTESGVFLAIMRSNSPKADEFRWWLADEVLPSIRRTGGFGASSGPSLEERVGRFALETAWYDPNRVSIVARVMRAMSQGANGVSGIALLAKMKQGNVRFALMEAERHGLVRQTQRGYELSVGEPSGPLVIDELARNLLGGGR